MLCMYVGNYKHFSMSVQRIHMYLKMLMQFQSINTVMTTEHFINENEITMQHATWKTLGLFLTADLIGR